MAIGTHAQLKTALTDWTDQGSTLDSYMDDFVRMATDGFNFGTGEISPLRVREMMAVVPLPLVDGVCTLPSDYLQYRSVVAEGSPRRKLHYITPGASDEFYPSRSGGPPCDFTIVGNSLQAFPVSGSVIELTYYQKIATLVDDDDTNWLLTDHPTLYLHAGILQIGLFRRDDELITRSVGFLNSYMGGMRSSGERSEFARGGTRIRQAP